MIRSSLVIPSLSAATFNSGNYQGQYVRVNDLTPQSAYVGEAWATGAKRKVVLDGPSSTTVQSYMATATDAPDFGMLYIKAATGPMLGTAEQNFNNIQPDSDQTVGCGRFRFERSHPVRRSRNRQS